MSRNKKLLIKTFRNHRCDSCLSKSEWLIRVQNAGTVETFVFCDDCFIKNMSDLWD